MRKYTSINLSCSSRSGNEFLNCGKSVIMCSRPASPNCPGSLFTSIRHFPPVIVANAHCTPLMIGEHTREKKPFYNSIFFHRRPYRLKLPLNRSDNSFALLAPTGFLHCVYSGLIRCAVHLIFHPIF